MQHECIFVQFVHCIGSGGMSDHDNYRLWSVPLSYNLQLCKERLPLHMAHLTAASLPAMAFRGFYFLICKSCFFNRGKLDSMVSQTA